MKPIGSRLSKVCDCCNHDKSSRGRETSRVRKELVAIMFPEGEPETDWHCDCVLQSRQCECA